MSYPEPGQYNYDVSSDDKLWALLAYLFTPIIPIVLMLLEDKKNRPFIKAHNVQALVLGLVIYVLAAVLTVAVIGPCIGALGFVYCIFLGVKAYKGEMVEIPLITNFVKNQGWA